MHVENRRLGALNGARREQKNPQVPGTDPKWTHCFFFSSQAALGYGQSIVERHLTKSRRGDIDRKCPFTETGEELYSFCVKRVGVRRIV